MGTPVGWTIRLLTPATEALSKIKDRRIQAQLQQAFQRLRQNPEQIGKPLSGELAGYRSLRAVSQEFRIIYRVNHDEIEVLIVAIGRRKEGDRDDVYQLAKRWLQRGLLEP
ncbi:MAG TPA: type II toxin-antitoxin system RelE/ParE family toxin [Ktedonobacterales bacterium]|nr:type II toxin-antitoxin system RelE/ParE family toxin [Ktedonobacterales bacterium]